MVHERADAPLTDADWRADFASATLLPDSHFQSVRAVRRKIRELQPDIVHSHSSYGGLYARLAASASPTARQVYTPHGWAFIRLDKSILERVGYWLAEGLLGRRTDVLAACSPDEVELFPRIAGRRAGLVLVPNVAPDSEEPQGVLPAVPEGDGVLIVGAGRLSRQKDPEYFADAIDAVRKAGYPVRAQWVGGGTPEEEAGLESRGVAVTGWSTPKETAAMLGRGDVYLHSARWDGFPLTVLEAHRRRVPTLLRAVTSFRRIEWPHKLGSPDSLAEIWPLVTSETGRRHLLESADHVLVDNNFATQRERLLTAYGIREIY